VRNVNEVMRVERNVYVVQLIFETYDHLRKALHVLLSARHIQRTFLRIAEVDLGIDNQQFNSLTHIFLFLSVFLTLTLKGKKISS
jgi:hypothetical protein